MAEMQESTSSCTNPSTSPACAISVLIPLIKESHMAKSKLSEGEGTTRLHGKENEVKVTQRKLWEIVMKDSWCVDAIQRVAFSSLSSPLPMPAMSLRQGKLCFEHVDIFIGWMPWISCFPLCCSSRKPKVKCQLMPTWDWNHYSRCLRDPNSSMALFSFIS